MAKILDGKEVAQSIIQDCAEKVSSKITKDGLAPKLSVVSVGSDCSNNSYLNGISKRASEAGVLLSVCTLDENASVEDVKAAIFELNDDNNVDGILLLRPLPDYISSDEAEICECISTDKDVDAAKSASVSSAFLGSNHYCPCTAEACIRILDYYNIDIEGKNVVVVGRSLVVGKPVAAMLLNRNATVTVCHSKTQNLEKITKEADIVIVAIGKAKLLTSKHFSSGQVVIDAGINWDEDKQCIYGDVDFKSVKDKVDAITKVPGGVGSVTSAVLISHVI